MITDFFETCIDAPASHDTAEQVLTTNQADDPTIKWSLTWLFFCRGSDEKTTIIHANANFFVCPEALSQLWETQTETLPFPASPEQPNGFLKSILFRFA